MIRFALQLHSLFFFFISSFTYATPVNSSRLGEPSADWKSEFFESKFGLLTTEYVNAGEPYFRKGANQENISLRLDLKGERHLAPAWLKFNVSDELSLSEQWNYLDAKEVYLVHRQDGQQFSVGRKLDTWAEWENVWRQGVFQPRYMENRLHPEQAGLTGLFFARQNDRWSLTAGLLAVYLPDFTAHYTIEDDRFVSKNPWFHPPAEEFLYRGQPGRIVYSVNQPSYGAVVNHPGGITKVEYTDHHYRSRLTYAYKPISQLALGFPSDHQLIAGGDMSIIIQPRVIYTRVTNWDNLYSQGMWKFSSSLAYDNPVDDKGPVDWTNQEYAPAWIFSGQVSRRFGESLQAPVFEVGFLKVEGGDGPDRGRFGDNEAPKFEHRFQYNEAYMVGIKRNFSVGYFYPLENEVRFIFDRLQNGAVFSLNSGIRLDRQWTAALNVDFLGLLSESRAEVNNAFLSTYRANDRATAGVTYVF